MKAPTTGFLLSVFWIVQILCCGISLAFERKSIEIVGLPYSPYIIIDKDNKTSGIIVDLVRMSLKEVGIEARFKFPTGRYHSSRSKMDLQMRSFLP